MNDLETKVCEVCGEPATKTVKFPILENPPKLRFLAENEAALDERKTVIPTTDPETGEKGEIVHYTTAPEFGMTVKHFCDTHNPVTPS